MIKFAIIGAGAIAGVNATAIQQIKNARLQGVYDIDKNIALQFSKRHNCKAYSTYKDVLKDKEIDAVLITTPNNTHAKLGIMAAEAGKHILVEKPIATDVKDAIKLVNKCKKNNVKLGVIFQHRFDDALIYLKKLINNGKFGQIKFASATINWHRDEKYYAGWHGSLKQSGGGVLMTQGIHFIDLLSFILGEPEKVFGIAEHTKKMKVEDSIKAEMHFSSGAVGLIDCTTAAAKNMPDRIEIIGTKKSVKIIGREIMGLGTIRRIISKLRYKYGSHNQVIQSFILAIEKNTAPQIGAEEGIDSLILVQAIYKSVRTKKAIEVKG